MEKYIVEFVISIICGLLSIRAVNRFLNDKIEQWSFEYQIVGFGGALVCVFGLIDSVGYVLPWILGISM